MESDKRSAEVGRLDVVETGRRRRWSEEEKLKIVLESLQAPRQISATARGYGLSRSLLLQWRRLFRAEQTGAAAQPIGFVPAVVVPDPGAASAAPAPSGSACGGTIEIEFATGARMRITGAVDQATLTAAMVALAGTLPLAEPGRRRSDDLIGAAGVSAVRHRLAPSAGDLASQLGGLRFLLAEGDGCDSIELVPPTSEPLPADLAAAHAMILAERQARLAADAEAASAQADLSSREALIAHLSLEIEKLRRTLYGTRSERQVRLIDQLELQLEELEAAATEDQLAAEAAERTQTARSFQRRRPVRKPFPDDIQRERIVIAAPTCCPCCGGHRLSKLGEDVTETLEVIPRQWKVIETVREKFTCRDCETITQPPAPFHATPRGLIGPKLLATILVDKFAQHLPLNRQSQRFKCEGIDLSVSTLAD